MSSGEHAAVRGGCLNINMNDRGRRRMFGGHVFTCPECHEHEQCNGACDIEPDLELDDGTPRCSYSVCDRCEAAKSPPSRLGEPALIRTAIRRGAAWAADRPERRPGGRPA